MQELQSESGSLLEVVKRPARTQSSSPAIVCGFLRDTQSATTVCRDTFAASRPSSKL